MQPLQAYIDRRQATVAEWVALRTIFKVCVKETGYKGGGRHRELWWRQAEANKQMRSTLEEILAAVRDWWQREYSRHGGGEVWEEETNS